MTGKNIHLNLDDATLQRLQDTAKYHQRTPHWLIKQALQTYLDNIEQNGTIEAPLGLATLAEDDKDALFEITRALPKKPFLQLSNEIHPQTPLRAAITQAYRRSEPDMIPELLKQAQLTTEQTHATHQMATQLASQLRHQKRAKGRAGLVQGLLQEYALSSQEGVALMCLAEALLRIPDKATRDALIRDKISQGHWPSHLGHSDAMLVNAATWGLVMTGKLLTPPNEEKFTASLHQILQKGGEPLIRKGMDMAMRMMGQQFVTGETIEKALEHAKHYEEKGFRYSYDMLGEAALTQEDAQHYFHSYAQSIHAIGQAANGRGIYEGPGISIKLSALHPRYSRAQYHRVMNELYPQLFKLATLAKQYDIGINIDAEEADRLEISLDLLEKLCFEPTLAGWNGIGFVIQAYQKRCPYVIDYVIDLAKRSQHRLMIRLVKGAYWDSEIKRAQVDGLEGYPVYTRKVYTDIAYLACAKKLLAVPESIFPQFATHNAHTVSAIYQLAGHNYYPGQYEFQCLHGMGEPLYEQVVGKITEGKFNRPCRIYAPVGTHQTLLAYLVRRLLENGANTSFVNRVADKTISIEQLIEDPVSTIEQIALQEERIGNPHPKIPLPIALYGDSRPNSKGLDLSNEDHLAALSSDLLNSADTPWQSAPMLGQATPLGEAKPVVNPADHTDIVGHVHEASEQDVDLALQCASAALPAWQATSPAERAGMLMRAADQLENEMPTLMGILIREAGKTCANAISEVREAVDFLRYYAEQAQHDFDNETHQPLGIVACISPWNFPLAIFGGQIAAALAAGNTVVAKPAEQTPLIAAQAIRILREAGVPAGAVQLLPGRGETIGAKLVDDSRIKGVMFTGSTEVAQILNRTIAGRLDHHHRPIPLIAETGGQNAMIVDSSALVEQAVFDIVSSAFDSAGQRCSALRVLCVQEEAAERVITMLKGAMDEYYVGRPDHLYVDMGPVIDAQAKQTIDRHIDAMRQKGHRIYQSHFALHKTLQHGTFVYPTLIELDRLDELQREVFGPVLHVIRYSRQQLPELMTQINQLGYGLTMGVHTRIDSTIDFVSRHAKVGNLYVNRNIVGAVVGVQPFGGENLSGTGPKAGGPLYMYRLLSQKPNKAALKSLTRRYTIVDAEGKNTHASLVNELKKYLAYQNEALVALLERFYQQAQAGTSRILPGPTGEKNTYVLSTRERILCLSECEEDALIQLAAVISLGATAIWPTQLNDLRAKLPGNIKKQVQLVRDWQNPMVTFDAVLVHGDPTNLTQVCRHVAKLAGPIVSVHGFASGETDIPLERLLVEQAISVNTAAAGGNTSLMTLS